NGSGQWMWDQINFLGRCDVSCNGGYYFDTLSCLNAPLLVKDINQEKSVSMVGAEYALLSNGKLLFVSDKGSMGEELWVSDGSSAGTFLVKDIREGSLSSNIKSLKSVGSKAY